MKHFILYGLAAALIFSMLGKFAAAETVPGAEVPTAAPVAVMAKALAAPEGEEEEPPEELLAGLLQVDMSSMDDMYFKGAGGGIFHPRHVHFR